VTAARSAVRADRPANPARQLHIGRRLADAAPALAVFVLVLVLWEVGLGALGVQQFLVPRPSVIAGALVDQWPTLQKGVVFTATEAIGGLAIGSGLGLLVAFAVARWGTARESLLPVAIAANAIPIIAFAPIANNWFSSESPAPRMMIVAVMTFFPMMINTVRGLTTVDPAAFELMHSYAASERVVMRKLRIPNALPYIFTALRITVTLSVIGAVVGEYFGGPTTALGIYISAEAGLFRFPNAWAAIVLSCVLGIVLFLAVVALERVVLPWYAAQREGSSQ
jgi:NitT/TauT family transport system permease protein